MRLYLSMDDSIEFPLLRAPLLLSTLIESSVAYIYISAYKLSASYFIHFVYKTKRKTFRYLEKLEYADAIIGTL